MRIQFIQDLIDQLRNKKKRPVDINKFVKISTNPDNPIIEQLFAKYDANTIKINKLQRKCFCNVNADPGVTEQSLSILSNLDLKNGNKLLNIGCGLKEQNSFLSDLGFDPYGIDIDIKEDSNHFKNHNLNANDNIPYNEKMFDFVLCQEVIEHLENPWLLFRKIKRVLKADGYLVLTTPNICCNKSRDLFRNNYYGFSQYFNEENLWQHINPIPYFEIIHISTYNDFKLEKLSGNKEYFLNFESPRDFTDNQKKEVTIANNNILHFLFKNLNNNIKEYIPVPTYNYQWK